MLDVEKLRKTIIDYFENTPKDQLLQDLKDSGFDPNEYEEEVKDGSTTI